MNFLVSRSKYFLQLVKTTESSTAKHLDAICKVIIENKDELIKWMNKRCEEGAKKYYGKYRCSICDYAENISNDDLRDRDFKINFDKFDKNNKEKCPIPLSIIDELGINNCKTCIETERSFGTNLDCNKVYVNMVGIFGTFDLALLWRAPDYFWGAISTMFSHEHDQVADILNIPCHRIKWSKLEKMEPISKKIALFTFIDVKEETPTTLDSICKQLKEMRKKNNTIECFLTYSSYPLMIKAEFDDDTSAHNHIALLRKNLNKYVSDTSTIFGNTILKDTEKNELEKIDNWIDIEMELVGGKLNSQFSIGIKVDNTKRSGEEEVENEVLKKLKRVCDQYPKLFEINIIPNRNSYVHGYWDAFYHLKAWSSKAVYGLISKHLRKDERITQCITIPQYGEVNL